MDDWLSGKIPIREEPVRQIANALGRKFEELWGSEIGLRADARTRLMQLESAVRQMRAILDQLETDEDFPSAAEYAQPFDEQEAGPERRPQPRKRGGRAS